MDRKSKIFIFVFIICILSAITISWYKFFILKDYIIKTEVPCNPNIESCLSKVCDPAQDNSCPEDVTSRVDYYKIIEEKAYDVSIN